MHIGIVAPLPLVPCGAAEWLAVAAPLYEQYADITFFVEDVNETSDDMRRRHRVKSFVERDDPSIDMLIYHIGNNPHHRFVFDAIMEGPAGIVEVHDGSLHHFVQDHYLGRSSAPFRYASLGEEAHGYAGRRLAEMRNGAFRGVVELFLYDYLAIALDRSRGVIVHSNYASELVQLRCPRVPIRTIPLHAPEVTIDPDARARTGVPADTLLIAHCGFVTLPKRPVLYLEAMRNVLDRGLNAHFVFVGADETRGLVQQHIDRLNLNDHVTITGYLETEDLERWVQAVDVIVNLRAPHVGESSGSLSYGLAAGKPVIVQPIGSWAEIPDDVVVRVPVTDDDTVPLANAMFSLGQDARLRERFSINAQHYARTYLDPHRCAQQVVDVAKQVQEGDWTPPAWEWPARIANVKMFHDSGSSRIRSFLSPSDSDLGALLHEALRQVTPARPNARLLAIDAPASLLQVLGTIYQYDVDARTDHGDDAPIMRPAAPGIGAFSTKRRRFETDDKTIARYDVIVANDIIGDTHEFLSWCNRALTPQGLLILLRNSVTEEALDDAGFSTRLHRDTPGIVLTDSQGLQYVTAGTKATIPLSTHGPSRASSPSSSPSSSYTMK